MSDFSQTGSDGAVPFSMSEWQRGTVYTVRPEMLAPLVRGREYRCTAIVRLAPQQPTAPQRETHPIPDPRTRALGPWRTVVEFPSHEDLFRCSGSNLLSLREREGGGVVYKNGFRLHWSHPGCAEKNISRGRRTQGAQKCGVALLSFREGEGVPPSRSARAEA